MTPAELRRFAAEKLEELGPEPSNPREHAQWSMERDGALELLAAYANWDRAFLLRAVMEIAPEWVDEHVHALLIDAAGRCPSR
jgi:hypothetical protein